MRLYVRIQRIKWSIIFRKDRKTWFLKLKNVYKLHVPAANILSKVDLFGPCAKEHEFAYKLDDNHWRELIIEGTLNLVLIHRRIEWRMQITIRCPSILNLVFWSLLVKLQWKDRLHCSMINYVDVKRHPSLDQNIRRRR